VIGDLKMKISSAAKNSSHVRTKKLKLLAVICFLAICFIGVAMMIFFEIETNRADTEFSTESNQFEKTDASQARVEKPDNIYEQKPSTSKTGVDRNGSTHGDKATGDQPKKETIIQPTKNAIKSANQTSSPTQVVNSSNPGNKSTQQSITTQGFVTNLDTLDPQSRDEIRNRTEKIIIDVPGIYSIKSDGAKIRISISYLGEVKLLEVTGIIVEPVEKLSDLRSALEKKFEEIKFSNPTIDSNMVELKIWLEFRKISKFYEKVIFER
jgi:hypothetical protein